ncbi:MAG: glycosyltransferase family 25 protein [Alphaproteobacteria bacterium]|nr:glycosyltransferase family 25 protein [Alphaproteobacteria bacterium]
MGYTGFYINLDRSTVRRAEIEAELSRYGLSGHYQRFVAAEGNPQSFPNPAKLKEGEMGCFRSHYLLLKANVNSSKPLHVVEDDAVFSQFTGDALRAVIAEGNLNHYDIVYTDLFIPTSNVLYRELKKAYDKNIVRDATGRVTQAYFSVMDMKGQKFASTASFLVNPQAIGKLHHLYEAELVKGPTLPIDLYICQKAAEGVLKVGCVFPYVTSIKVALESDTTIRGSNPQLSEFAANLVRRSFFIEADLQDCLEQARKFLPLPPEDQQLQLLTHILGFSVTDKYIRF